MTTIVIILVIVVVLIAARKHSNKTKLKSEQLGYDFSKLIKVGAYISGHPDINESKKSVSAIMKDDKLHFLHTPNDHAITIPVYLGEMDPKLIKDIVVEDQSTFEKRISIGRAALVGVFALLWKKKTKNELVYLTIKWNDGRFDHEAVFEFEGAKSMISANTARNSLIKVA